VLDPDDPLVEKENKQERLVQSFKRIEADELAREKWLSDTEFSRQPWWIQQELEGDYHYGRNDMDWEEDEHESGR